MTKHYRSLDAATPLRFTMSSCKRKETALRTQPQLQATGTQPLQCDFAKRFAKTELQNRMDKKKISKHFLKGTWKGKSLAPKLRISADESLSQPWCSHSNGQPFQHLQNTIEICISCETSFKNWKWKMWNRSFRARRPSKSKSGRCENEAFMRDVPPKVEVEDVKQSFRVRSPSKSESGRCETEAFVRDVPQNLKVEDAKMKLSCEMSLQK